MSSLTAALGPDVSETGVLLTANDSTAADRLAQREIGSGLEDAIQRSKAAATKLQLNAPFTVHRISTDQREVRDIAAEIMALSGWGKTAQRAGRSPA